MNYKASLDKFAIGITIFIIILFIVLGCNSANEIIKANGNVSNALAHTGILIFFVLTLVICYLYAPVSYSISSSDLTIIRRAHNKAIHLSEISEVQRITNEDLKGMIRTFGVGGLFGYFGRFYNSKLGHLIVFATQRKNQILIKTNNGKKIIITPDDASMIENLKAKLSITN